MSEDRVNERYTSWSGRNGALRTAKTTRVLGVDAGCPGCIIVNSSPWQTRRGFCCWNRHVKPSCSSEVCNFKDKMSMGAVTMHADESNMSVEGSFANSMQARTFLEQYSLQLGTESGSKVELLLNGVSLRNELWRALQNPGEEPVRHETQSGC